MTSPLVEWFSQRRLAVAAALLPSLGLLPLLAVPIPRGHHAAREVAGYFQTLALLRDGVGSYGYVTLAESDAALHLYSVLSTPFVAVGYVEGGRLVSAVAAVCAALLLGYIAAQFYGEVAGVLAVAGLWANPYFLRFAWGVTPEATGIALVTGSVAAAVRYDATDDGRWFGVALVLLALGITNHGWEAVVALPVAAVVLHRREWLRAGSVFAVAGLTLALVDAIVALQPTGADTGSYLLGQSGSLLVFSVDWWAFWLAPVTEFPSSPFQLSRTVLFFGALVAVAIVGSGAFRPRGRAETVLAAWLLSGLAIPFALPGGAMIHYYYLWAVVPPLTVALAALGSLVHGIVVDATGVDSRTVLRLVLCVVVVAGFVNVGVGGVRPVPSTDEGTPVTLEYQVDTTPDDLAPGEAERAGRTVRQYGVDRANAIVFVGNWTGWVDGYGDYYRSGVVRVMVYSDTVVRGVWHRERVSASATVDAPRFAASNASVGDCHVTVHRRDTGTAFVRRCPG